MQRSHWADDSVFCAEPIWILTSVLLVPTTNQHCYVADWRIGKGSQIAGVGDSEPYITIWGVSWDCNVRSLVTQMSMNIFRTTLKSDINGHLVLRTKCYLLIIFCVISKSISSSYRNSNHPGTTLARIVELCPGAPWCITMLKSC